jgi:mRNA interferase MazF
MPRRGEVWLVDLGLAGKTPPAVILSKPFGDADRALITVIPHTLSLRGSQFEIPIASRFLRGGAFLVQNPVTIPAAKAESLLGRLSASQITQIEAGVRDWLCL